MGIAHSRHGIKNTRIKACLIPLHFFKKLYNFYISVCDQGSSSGAKITSRRIGKDVHVCRGDAALTNRRGYLQTAVAGGGALSMPTIAKAQNKTWKLRMRSNWTGIGIQSQDRSAEIIVERVNKLSVGRIDNYQFRCRRLTLHR